VEQYIALVDSRDKIIGFEEKHLAHSKGLLHRAFSIIVFNRKGELLLQRRSLDKYHSSGLWANTCCSHLPKDSVMDEFIHKRLLDEMGFDCNLTFVTKFHYQVDFGDGMTENEIDHVFIGRFDGNLCTNPREVSDWKWVNEDWLIEEVKNKPVNYTY